MRPGLMAAIPEPRIGRAAASGAAIGFVVAAPLFMCVALAFGAGAGGAIAIGLFVGIWGGCGWGGMLAATLSLTRADLRAAREAGPTDGDAGPVRPA